MLHSFSSRGPSQKLSNPAPSKGLGANAIRVAQRSVRPVSVGFLPTAVRRKLPTLRNNTQKQKVRTKATKTCTNIRLRTIRGELVTTNKALAITKQASDVIELAIQKSQTVIATSAP